jgi:hypothetical protein
MAGGTPLAARLRRIQTSMCSCRRLPTFCLGERSEGGNSGRIGFDLLQPLGNVHPYMPFESGHAHDRISSIVAL